MQFHKTVLENGLRIITVPQPGNLAVTVLVLVEAGSKYETKDKDEYNRGVSHFLEHMCFKGTEKRKTSLQIAGEFDGLGASYNAFTSLEYTGYYAKAQAKDFDKVLDLVSDIYLNPTFNEAEIEKERGVIIEEINMGEDDSPHKAAEIFMKLLYGDAPAGWDIAGTKEDILRLKKSDILNYRRGNYLAGSTIVVVSGAFNENVAIERIKESFASIPSGEKAGKEETREKQSEPSVRLKFKDSDQTHIVLGARGYDVFDKRRIALEVLGCVLGGGMSSRLYQILRNKLGAAYYVSASADLYSDHGYLAVSAGVDQNKIKAVIGEVLGQFEDLRETPVSAEELARVKSHLIGGIILGLETSNSLASFYGGQEIVERKMLTPEEVIAEIQAVTPREIMAVANDIFVNDKLNLAVLGPIKDEAMLRSIFRFK